MPGPHPSLHLCCGATPAPGHSTFCSSAWEAMPTTGLLHTPLALCFPASFLRAFSQQWNTAWVHQGIAWYAGFWMQTEQKHKYLYNSLCLRWEHGLHQSDINKWWIFNWFVGLQWYTIPRYIRLPIGMSAGTGAPLLSQQQLLRQQNMVSPCTGSGWDEFNFLGSLLCLLFGTEAALVTPEFWMLLISVWTDPGLRFSVLWGVFTSILSHQQIIWEYTGSWEGTQAGQVTQIDGIFHAIKTLCSTMKSMGKRNVCG